MATKLLSVVALCSALFAVAAAAAADSPSFVVEGRVFCDTCRAGFETTATEYLAGAKVRLECKHEESEELVHTVEGTTDATGTYHLKVADDHEDELCEVVLVESPHADCSEIKTGRDRARILLTHNSGLAPTSVSRTPSDSSRRSPPLLRRPPGPVPARRRRMSLLRRRRRRLPGTTTIFPLLTPSSYCCC
ncbi:unnamed protein product [Spirodela intermedia]|uniref:Uncharacterized protein n=1 Tax=Spirodela intermedia TaxID=51605 RepID=A0A7I8IF47_SPIIN|nr:unnamed protein product [Spirodela intermedia]CAA6656428.1 unnamed protein product [Spirodela intermedia]